MKFYMYEHWRVDTNQCFYVGKGQGQRAYKMRDRNPYHTAIQKHLKNLACSVEVRIVQSGLTEEQAFAVEVQRIAYWISLGVRLANMSSGGEGASGVIVSKETKAKLRAIHLGKPKTKVHALKISLGKQGIAPRIKGFRHSDETKAKISHANKGNTNKLGLLWSAESRDKLSRSMQGNTHTKGRVMPLEQKQKIAELFKKTIALRRERQRASL